MFGTSVHIAKLCCHLLPCTCVCLQRELVFRGIKSIFKMTIQMHTTLFSFSVNNKCTFLNKICELKLSYLMGNYIDKYIRSLLCGPLQEHLRTTLEDYCSTVTAGGSPQAGKKALIQRFFPLQRIFYFLHDKTEKSTQNIRNSTVSVKI